MHRFTVAVARRVFFYFVFFTTSCLAQDRVSDALEALDHALVGEKGISEVTRHALRRVVGEIRDERIRYGPMVSELDTKLTAIVNEMELTQDMPNVAMLSNPRTKLTLSGDFRYRFEASFDQDGRADRYRQRIRTRLAANFQINDEVKVGVRFITGDPDDPNSPHQTLGNVFDSFAVSLDRVNLVYSPKWLPGLSATVGKFGNSFRMNPVYGELVWDADVQPEGALLEYVVSTDGALKSFEFRAGLFDVLEQGNADDAFAYTGQIAATFRLASDLQLAASAAYYYWTDPTPDGSQSILGDDAGNVLVDRNLDGLVDDFQSDFGILDLVAAVTYDRWVVPLTLAGEFIWNHRAEGERDMGFAVGIAAGSTAKPGDWKVFYTYQIVEQDAVFSPVAQDDFLLQTNHQSHLLGIDYKVADDIGIRLWTLISARDTLGTGLTNDEGHEQFRIRLDLNITF
ncbi:MAG: putative porin [Planctomycetes bacterium]|nr:putative porin [Planctomycetota bacterium]